MITCYFGVPGVGKTTLLTKFARKELKRIRRHKSKYTKVYSNFYCEGCYKIDFDDLANYKIYDALILLDEIGLDADNRKFKSFSDNHRDFFTLHRHLNIDLIIATQQYDKIDAKIVGMVQELWYMSKSVLPFFNRFTKARRIYRNITINEYTSELKMGYRFCNLLESFFTSNVKFVYRPFYYSYFNSFDELNLKDRPVFESSLYPVEVKKKRILKFKKLFKPRKVKIT